MYSPPVRKRPPVQLGHGFRGPDQDGLGEEVGWASIRNADRAHAALAEPSAQRDAAKYGRIAWLEGCHVKTRPFHGHSAL